MIVSYFKAGLLSQHFPGRTKQDRGNVLIRAARLRTEIHGSNSASPNMDSDTAITSQHRSFEIRTEYLTQEKHAAKRVDHLRNRPSYISFLQRKTYSWSHEMWGQRQGPFAAYRKWRTRAGCDVTRRNVERSRVALSLSMALRHLPDGNWGTHVTLTGGCQLHA